MCLAPPFVAPFVALTTRLTTRLRVLREELGLLQWKRPSHSSVRGCIPFAE